MGARQQIEGFPVRDVYVAICQADGFYLVQIEHYYTKDILAEGRDVDREKAIGKAVAAFRDCLIRISTRLVA